LSTSKIHHHLTCFCPLELTGLLQPSICLLFFLLSINFIAKISTSNETSYTTNKYITSNIQDLTFQRNFSASQDEDSSSTKEQAAFFDCLVTMMR
jgi:hypothetical protein